MNADSQCESAWRLGSSAALEVLTFMAAEKLETETRQDQITNAALDLIAAKGISELGIAKIADRDGEFDVTVTRRVLGNYSREF